MKKNYIIQDANNVLRTICFSNLRSMQAYMKNNGYHFIQSMEDGLGYKTAYGAITDNAEGIERNVYVREIETSRYGEF